MWNANCRSSSGLSIIISSISLKYKRVFLCQTWFDTSEQGYVLYTYSFHIEFFNSSTVPVFLGGTQKGMNAPFLWLSDSEPVGNLLEWDFMSKNDPSAHALGMRNFGGVWKYMKLVETFPQAFVCQFPARMPPNILLPLKIECCKWPYFKEIN